MMVHTFTVGPTVVLRFLLKVMQSRNVETGLTGHILEMVEYCKFYHFFIITSPWWEEPIIKGLSYKMYSMLSKYIKLLIFTHRENTRLHMLWPSSLFSFQSRNSSVRETLQKARDLPSPTSHKTSWSRTPTAVSFFPATQPLFVPCVYPICLQYNPKGRQLLRKWCES